ncbi:MAG TPA: hypothetical protein VGV61_12615 [Thermoanaerobaculia bacterium]|jgi:hypothetical protein|nr:hypothetical protein [Thermoanaerobaculia bacterium]
MILRLALRSLAVHPVRSAVLAGGFGVGVSVMAALLGVGEVVLEQARAPGLLGGGDVIVYGATGRVSSARFVLSNVIQAPPLGRQVEAASPQARADLYLRGHGRPVLIRARGGIPSLERAVGDPEIGATPSWVDVPADVEWASLRPETVLRSIDRFHPLPDVPGRAGSWAEWLYFNGSSPGARFYLTFLVGPRLPDGRRIASVRLQLDRGGRLSSFATVAEVDEARVLATAPDLDIAGNRVRVDGSQYRLTLDLPEQPAASRAAGARSGRRAAGELTLDAIAGRALPPIAIRGAGGWQSGYVVPVMSGPLRGALTVDGERIALDGSGYHDHNWGFWEGVSWSWGQVQKDGLSFIYGRIHPPADAADPARVPGFLAALGPDGLVGYSADVTIEETVDPHTGRPVRIVVQGKGPSLDLRLQLAVEGAVVTPMPQGAFGCGMSFFQLRVRYRVTGRAGDREIAFEAAGSAETFRNR